MSVAVDFRSNAGRIAPHRGAYSDELDSLPFGSVIEGERCVRAVDDAADFVIIGSGASGATAAVVLAEAGYDVVLVEEGPWIRTKDFGTDMYGSMKRMMRGMGSQVMLGKALTPMLQGSCVGGSTTINSAIAWRTPDAVLHEWGARYGIGRVVNSDLLDPHFTALEDDLMVRSVGDDALGGNNSMFGEGADKLGVESHRIRRYDAGCEGRAGCITGCRAGKKLSMNITYVPRALHAGARIYSSARVAKIETRHGRAVGIVGSVKGIRERLPLRIHARRGVFVAASTIQTPNLLRRSGVRSRALGRHFQAHPGVSMAGFFDRSVDMDFGASQGWNSLAILKSHRIKLESLMLPPELAAARTPGFGAEMMHRMAEYGHMAIWAVVVRSEVEGRIWDLFGSDAVQFGLNANDLSRARVGLKLLAQMMFAAGAREIWPGVHGMPTVLTSPDQLDLWDNAPIDQRAYNFMASHFFGAARMGPDPKSSVVGLDFAVHGLQGAYVVDSSIFPTNLGVNPQHSIMGIARLAATRVAESPLGVT